MKEAWSNMPPVSVVMAVYNGEIHLCETVASILGQSWKDFEYIIINDGSTDATAELLSNSTDSRVRIIHNQQNRGLPYSLNRGFELAQGKYIARIDVGDIAASERLEKQVMFLETHPEIGIIGSACLVIDNAGNELRFERFPLHDLEIRWASLLRNPFLHPAVMLCRNVLEERHLRYDTDFHTAQDYELWMRMLEYTQGANLPEALISYRISPTSMTAQFRVSQLQNHDAIALHTIRQQLPDFSISQEQVTQLREAIAGGTMSKDRRKTLLITLSGLYLDMLAAFVKKHARHPELRRLQHQETLRMASKVFQWRYKASWVPILRRIVRLYPWFFVPLLQRNLRRTFNRLR